MKAVKAANLAKAVNIPAALGRQATAKEVKVAVIMVLEGKVKRVSIFTSICGGTVFR